MDTCSSKQTDSQTRGCSRWGGALLSLLMQGALCIFLLSGCANQQASLEREPGVDHLTKVFEKLWKAYPNKTDKEAAIQAWNTLKVSDEELKQMRMAYPQWRDSAEWKRDKGAHVPPLATFLTDRMWEQEAPPLAPPPPLRLVDLSSFLIQPIYLAPRLAYAISGSVVGGMVYPFDQTAAGKVWDSSLNAPWVWHEFIAGKQSDE